MPGLTYWASTPVAGNSTVAHQKLEDALCHAKPTGGVGPSGLARTFPSTIGNEVRVFHVKNISISKAIHSNSSLCYNGLVQHPSPPLFCLQVYTYLQIVLNRNQKWEKQKKGHLAYTSIYYSVFHF